MVDNVQLIGRQRARQFEVADGPDDFGILHVARRIIVTADCQDARVLAVSDENGVGSRYMLFYLYRCPAPFRARLPVRWRLRRGFSMRDYELSADSTGVAPERVDSRVGLTSILQAAQGRLIHASELRHRCQRQPGGVPRHLQLVDHDFDGEVSAALDRAFIGAARLQLLLGGAMLEFRPNGLVPGAIGRAPFRLGG